MRQLRLLRESQFRGGPGNMAADCAILDAVARCLQPPTLRLYGWRPMCLSLGYGQRSRDVDEAALTAREWQLLRRPTGGKAILHGDELTYSLCLPRDHPLSGENVVDSYRRISAALVRALTGLGLSAASACQDVSRRDSGMGPVCFEVSSHYEITVDGRKLIGSAQMRRKAAILQHGTLPLRGDLGRICDVLAFETDAEREAHRQSVRRRAVTLSELLGSQPSWHAVAEAIQRAFEETFSLQIRPGEMSAYECRRMAELEEERFRNADWTHKR